MAVLVEGMEMPKSCYDCDFAYQDQDSEHNVYWTCAAVHKLACVHERRDDCPLVPVPPHGDLIDRDAAAEKIWDDMRFPSNLANAQFFVNELREMPTIIPAEEGDE